MSILRAAVLAMAGLLLTGCATMGANAPLATGDWVLAHWQSDETYYWPAIVSGRDGDMVSLQYDDGDVGAQPAAAVRRFDWRVGTRLECRWSDERFYPARIVQMDANRYDIRVAYDDGDKGMLNTSRCRSR